MANRLGMFDMRNFRYRYTGKIIPVIPVYRFFTSCKVALNWFFKTIKKFETIL